MEEALLSGQRKHVYAIVESFHFYKFTSTQVDLGFLSVYSIPSNNERLCENNYYARTKENQNIDIVHTKRS